jgi:hypothetical protein
MRHSWKAIPGSHITSSTSTTTWKQTMSWSHEDHKCNWNNYTKGKGKGLPVTCHESTKTGRWVIAPLILNLGARLGWLSNAKSRPIYPRGKSRITYCTGGEWTLGSVWTGVRKIKSSAPTWVRTANRPASPLQVAVLTTLSRPPT